MARPDNVTLKRELSRRFRSTRFRVYSGRGTSRSWSHIAWTDGPSEGLVLAVLGMLGATPGSMDETDYFNGERVSLYRTSSEMARQRVARALLAPHPVPAREAWGKDVNQQPGRGWYNFEGCVLGAAANRLDFERYRFEALCWLAAITAGTTAAPQSVTVGGAQ